MDDFNELTIAYQIRVEGFPIVRVVRPKPDIHRAVRLEKVLRLFLFMVHSALETYSQALTLSFGKIKRTILTGIEYLSGAPTSAILLSEMDVYIVKSLCF